MSTRRLTRGGGLGEPEVPPCAVARLRRGAAGDGRVIAAAPAVPAFPPVDQAYLFQARQLQALSFAAHIPLVCFGDGVPHARAVRRVARPADAATASTARSPGAGRGAARPVRRRGRDRDDPQLRAGHALAELHGDLRLASSASRSRSRASRSSPRRSSSRSTSTAGTGSRRALHLARGHPRRRRGITGSLMVISVNAWMNHPARLRAARRPGGRRAPVVARSSATRYLWHEVVHMYLAGLHGRRLPLAGVYAWARLRGRCGRYERTALAIPLAAAALASPVQVVVGDWAGRAVAARAAGQAGRVRGARARRERGAPIHVLGWYDGGGVEYGIGIPRLLSLLALPRPERDACRARRGAAGGPAAGQRRPLLLPDDGRHRHAARRCSALVYLAVLAAPAPPARVALVLPRARRRRARSRSSRSSPAGSRPRSAASPGSSTA